MHRHALTPIETAQEELATERAQVAAERDAFERFAERVAALDFTQPVDPPRPGVRFLDQSAVPEKTSSAQVKAAYQETVMAVDHYEAVYSESLATNVRGELGPDIAAGLCDEAPLSPPFKTGLLATVEQAHHERETFLDRLATEAASLETARTDLHAIASTASEIAVSLPEISEDDNARSDVADLTEQCESVIGARQQCIHDSSVSDRLDGHDLCEYLYAAAAGNWTYPVLSVGASIHCDLDGLGHRLSRPFDRHS